MYFFTKRVLVKEQKMNFFAKITPDSENVGHCIELKIKQHFAAITLLMCSNYILRNQTFPMMRKD